MSVINDSEKGDEIVCLEEFSGAPQGIRRSAETVRTFHIGDRVRYLGFFRHQNLFDHPVCWNLIFEADDGKRYNATQTYFVTTDCWDGLRKHFAMKRRTATRATNSKRAGGRLSTGTKEPMSASKKRRSA